MPKKGEMGFEENSSSRVKIASVRGKTTYEAGPDGDLFSGTIEFRLRKYAVDYLIHLCKLDGTILLMKGNSLALCKVLENEDPFESALQHSLEQIRRYRMSRRREFAVEGATWKQ